MAVIGFTGVALSSAFYSFTLLPFTFLSAFYLFALLLFTFLRVGVAAVLWLIDKKNTLILINELQRKTMFNLKSFKMNESLTASIVILVKQSVNLP